MCSFWYLMRCIVLIKGIYGSANPPELQCTAIFSLQMRFSTSFIYRRSFLNFIYKFSGSCAVWLHVILYPFICPAPGPTTTLAPCDSWSPWINKVKPWQTDGDTEYSSLQQLQDEYGFCLQVSMSVVSFGDAWNVNFLLHLYIKHCISTCFVYAIHFHSLLSVCYRYTTKYKSSSLPLVFMTMTAYIS